MNRGRKTVTGRFYSAAMSVLPARAVSAVYAKHRPKPAGVLRVLETDNPASGKVSERQESRCIGEARP
jgi:hypothetical protein